MLIWATGRVPNSAGLGLAEAGVALDARGYVTVDERQDTSVEGVHALGDVTGRLALTPVATASARHLADRLFGGKPEARLDYADVPTVVFFTEPVGSVGLGEREARTRHGDAVRVYRARFTPMRYALVGREQPTFMKLVCAGDEERIVGIHMLGHAVDEMLQGFAVALKLGARKADLEATVAIHPTSAEELVLMR